MRRTIFVLLILSAVAVAGCQFEVPDYSNYRQQFGAADTIAYGPGDRLYVLNPYYDVVARWELAEDKVKLYDVCEGPLDMALAGDGSRIVVACPNEDEVSFIDLGDGEVRTIDTNPMPWAVAIDDEGEVAVIAEYAGDSVLIVDMDTLNQTRLFVPGGPVEVAITPDGQTAIAAAYWDNSVSMIDLEAKEVSQRLSEEPYDFNRPQDVVIGLDGTPSEGLAFIANRDYFTDDDRLASRVVAVDVTDGTYIEEVAVAPGPKALTLAEDGDALLTVSTVFLSEYPANTASYVTIGANVELEEIYRFVVRDEAVAAAMVPGQDVMAVANLGDDSLSLLNTNTLNGWTADVSVRPFGVVASPGGKYVYTAHDHPLGSVSILTISDGSVLTIDSLIFRDVLED